MKLLLLDQLRKVRQSWLNFLSLGLLVVIITMTFTAVTSSVRRLEENYEPYLESQQLEDFYFSMGEVDVTALSGRALWELCQELSLETECGLAISIDDPVSYNNLNVIINQTIKETPDTYESFIDQYADQFVDEYGYTYEKGYIADITEGDYIYKFVSTTSQIDIPYLVAGELPDELNEIAIFPEFAEANNIAIGDYLTIRNQMYEVTGFMYKVEFLFPIFSLQTITFDASQQTLVLATKETMETLNEHLFIKYLVQGDLDQAIPDFGYNNIQSNDYSMLGRHMQMIYLLMPSDINFRIIALDAEITNATAFINVFLPLFILMVGLLLIIFMKRYIEQNKSDISILSALGYSKNELTIALLVYPTLIALTSIIGYGLGLILSNQLFDLYSARYLFPKPGFIWYPDIVLYAVVVPIVFLVVVNIVFIRFSLQTNRTKTPRRFLRLHKYVGLKTILYTGLLFLTISVMLLFGLNGNAMFTDFVDYTQEGNHYQEMVSLQYMTNENHLDTYETYTKSPITIIGVNSETLQMVHSSTIYGMSPDSSLKRLIDDDISNNLLLEDGAIISEYLHTTLNLEVGDTITYQLGDVERIEPIMGISNELLENNIYIAQDRLNALFGLNETYYNGLYTTDYEYQSPYIVTRIDYVNSLNEFASVLNISSLIINYLVVLSLVLSLFIFALIMLNYLADHRRDIAVLKSLGYNNRELHIKYLLILYILMVVLFLASIPITDQILKYLLGMITDTIGFKLIVNIRVISIIIGLFILHVIFALVTYYSTSYYDSITLASVLKRSPE